MREFGERHPTASYTLRPSAYAVITGADSRIAVVRTPDGVFLPGGGCKAGESGEETAAREVMEECGMRVQVGPLLCRATELVYSPSETTFFEIPSAFFEATVVSTGHACAEPDHVLDWLPPASAIKSMVRESHAWAVDESAVEQSDPTDGDSRRR